MSFLSDLFGTKNAPVAPTSTPILPVNFADQCIEQLDALGNFIRTVSDVLSTDAYSHLRSIDDLIRPMLSYIKDHPMTAESEFAVKALLTDYIPSPLNIFLSLPSAEKLDGGKADLLLVEQYATLEKSVRDLVAEITSDVVSSLETHKIFIQNKFRGD